RVGAADRAGHAGRPRGSGALFPKGAGFRTGTRNHGQTMAAQNGDGGSRLMEVRGACGRPRGYDLRWHHYVPTAYRMCFMTLDTWFVYLLACIGLSLSPGPNGLLALTHGAI